MIVAILAVVLSCQEIELGVEARPLRSERGYGLQISGRARGLPDGAVIRLRFDRLVNRLEGRSLTVRPAERSWVRLVPVRNNMFTHREVLAAPVEIRLEASFDPCEQAVAGCGENAAAVVCDFRTASVSDVASAIRREIRWIERALAEVPRDGEKGWREWARRQMAALREKERESLFPAAVSSWACLLESLLVSGGESVVHGPGARLSGIGACDLSAAMEDIREIFRRERAALVAREAGRLRREGHFERELTALRGAAGDDGRLLAFLQEMECRLRAPSGDGAGPEALAAEYETLSRSSLTVNEIATRFR